MAFKQGESDSGIAERISVELRLRAVTEVLGRAPVVEVAERFGITRQTVTAWRKLYESEGLNGLASRSRRPHSSPGRTSPEVEALICELRRHHRRWGARRIAYELQKEIGDHAPSRSTIHRALRRTREPSH